MVLFDAGGQLLGLRLVRLLDVFRSGLCGFFWCPVGVLPSFRSRVAFCQCWGSAFGFESCKAFGCIQNCFDIQDMVIHDCLDAFELYFHGCYITSAYYLLQDRSDVGSALIHGMALKHFPSKHLYR